MQKFEMRILFGQFGKQAMHAKIAVQHIGIVK